MLYEYLIKTGGVFHLVCGLFHVAYPKMFKWKKNMEDLREKEKKVIKENLYVSNASMLVFWIIFAAIPFFYSHELLTTPIGKALLSSIVIFWVLRIFVIQTFIAGLKTKESWFRIGFFLIGFALFSIPLIGIL